jgi:hypothetical protein
MVDAEVPIMKKMLKLFLIINIACRRVMISALGIRISATSPYTSSWRGTATTLVIIFIFVIIISSSNSSSGSCSSASNWITCLIVRRSEPGFAAATTDQLGIWLHNYAGIILHIIPPNLIMSILQLLLLHVNRRQKSEIVG